MTDRDTLAALGRLREENEELKSALEDMYSYLLIAKKAATDANGTLMMAAQDFEDCFTFEFVEPELSGGNVIKFRRPEE
jgi:hypothetical protein